MSRLLQDVVGELTKLPGVGRRTALRLAIHLLRMEPESVHDMTRSINRFRDDVKYCAQCNNLSDEEICPICSDPERDHSTICVVEQVADVLSIENTHQYRGLYHVLGGVISPRLHLFPRYDGGKFTCGNSTMIVSRGLGMHTIPFRFNNPGELVDITIRKRKNNGSIGKTAGI